MPRSPAPQWKKRQEPIVDDLIHASVQQANGVHDENGHFATLVYAGCPTYERAKEINDALYRCAQYLHRHKILDIGMKAEIKKQADGTFNVEFRACDKSFARAYVLATYGEDRSKWPYDPRKKSKKD
jgi:hypothetical protein